MVLPILLLGVLLCGGCAWGKCEGVPAVNCSSATTKAACEDLVPIGCAWDADIPACGGTVPACNTQLEEDPCEAIAGCDWKDEISAREIVAIIVGVLVGFVIVLAVANCVVTLLRNKRAQRQRYFGSVHPEHVAAAAAADENGEPSAAPYQPPAFAATAVL